MANRSNGFVSNEHSTMSAFAVEEICRPSSSMSCDGFWSGTEERNHQPYIAMIPECRYLDPGEILQKVIEQYFKFIHESHPQQSIQKPVKPKKPRPYRRYAAPVVESRYDRAYNAHMSGWPSVVLGAWAEADPNGRIMIEMGHEQGWDVLKLWLEYRLEPIQEWMLPLIGSPPSRSERPSRTLFVATTGEVFFRL
jgi:hypothetical protein